MTPRSLALVLGLAYLGLGALGLMPGALAGLFRANPGLATIHLVMGAWAIAAYMGRASAVSYVRKAAFVFAALALVGLLHGLDQFLMPLDGANVWLHLATAAAAGFVGWRPGTGERRGLSGDRRRPRRRAAVATERRHGTYERRKAPAAA
ncbi:MAG TPA: DUF4383 domain-containing protein [Burkholderiales bacterium]|nr:DUF4383 domain-containing protein [Burkholderiales bacterium]